MNTNQEQSYRLDTEQQEYLNPGKYKGSTEVQKHMQNWWISFFRMLVFQGHDM